MPLLQRMFVRMRNLWAPPPMRDFDDYDDYWDQRGAIGTVFQRWVKTADELPEEGTVLDFGCGSGEFLTYLRQRRPRLVLYGADYSAKSVEMTQNAGFEAHVVNILERELDGRYDYITCFEVLEHIPDAEVVMQRLRTACAHRMFVSIPNVGFIGCRIRLALFGRFPTTRCVMHIKEHLRFWTVRDFREWARHCGLRVVRVYGVNGVKPLPWRRWPSLFASGALYALEPIGAPARERERTPAGVSSRNIPAETASAPSPV